MYLIPIRTSIPNLVFLALIVAELKTLIQTKIHTFTSYDLPLSIILMLLKLLIINCCFVSNTYVHILHNLFPFLTHTVSYSDIYYPTRLSSFFRSGNPTG